MRLLRWLLTWPVAKRWARNTVAALVAQATVVADHHVGWAHVGLAVGIGVVTAFFKALRDAFPTSPWVEYLPL